MWGEDFDYSTVDKAVGNFYHCIAAKLVNEAKAEFQAKVNADETLFNPFDKDCFPYVHWMASLHYWIHPQHSGGIEIRV